jgi:hypothetical protein
MKQLSLLVELSPQKVEIKYHKWRHKFQATASTTVTCGMCVLDLYCDFRFLESETNSDI